MKYNCNDEEVMERCGTERNMKDNCETEPGEEIEIECGSIDDAVCVGILVDKVFDCATGQQCPQYSNKDEEFTLTGDSSWRRGGYEEGASICIDSIGLCYDYIGLQDEMPRVEGGQITVKYDAIPKEFTSVEGTEFNHPNGETLYFDYDVVEIEGRIPVTGLANVTVDEVCMNYSSIEVVPGIPSIEDFQVMEVEDNAPCDTVFEYAVCPEKNATCCARNRGQSVSYKERGLTVIVNNLVLELRCHCGCTKIRAFAYPAVQQMGGQLCRVDSVEFRYNTLAARMCIPSNGRSLTLRQNYQTSLTVDCISKAYISAQDCCGCDCDDCFELTIPSGIDLICCIEETVSILISDQVVVLAVSQGINPRVVDTFANVCSFPSCGQ